MFAPTFLSDADRARLVEINQTLLSRLPDEERQTLLQEQAEVMERRKNLADCSYDELQQLRQQLFHQFQMHSSIGSSQMITIGRFLQMVEQREQIMMLTMDQDELNKKAETTNAAKPRGPSRVSTRKTPYSWTVAASDDD